MTDCSKLIPQVDLPHGLLIADDPSDELPEYIDAEVRGVIPYVSKDR